MKENTAASRIKSFDFTRGVCALGIILYHFSCHSVSGTKIIRYIGSCPIGDLLVTAFFILSGCILGLKYRRFSSVSDFRVFYYKRWKSIFPMFYLCFLFFFLQNVFNTGRLFYGPAPKTLFLTLLGVDGYLLATVPNYYIVGEWFLGAIVILYLVFPFLVMLRKKSSVPGDILSLALFLSVLLLDRLGRVSFRNILVCLCSFSMGVTVSSHRSALLERKAVGIGAAVLFLASCFLNLLPPCITTELVRGFLLFTALICIGNYVMEIDFCSRIFSWLGRISFPIFLMQHQVILKVLNVKNPVSASGTFLILIIIVVMTLAGSAILNVVADSVLNSKAFRRFEKLMLKGTAAPASAPRQS